MASRSLTLKLAPAGVRERSAITLGTTSILLLLALVPPVRGFSVPKPVVSGFSGLITTIGSDSSGNLYFVQNPGNPSVFNEEDLYRVAFESATPRLVFQSSFPSAQSVTISYMSFDGSGNLYFLNQVTYPPDESGNSEIDSEIYKLVASDLFAPTVLYTASASTFCGSAFCISSGDALVSIGTNSRGDVAAGLLHFSSASGSIVGELLSIPVKTGIPTVQTTFGENVFPDGQTALAVNDRGDTFLVLLNFTASQTVEVAQNGALTVLAETSSSPQTSFPLGLGLDASGDLYLVVRTLIGRQCLGVATSTTFTIEEFKHSVLAQATPEPLIVSQQTYSGYIIIAGDPTQVRVSSGGTVFYASYPSAMTSCSDPLAWRARVLALRNGDSNPMLVAAGTNPPSSLDFLLLATFGSNLYYASQVSGAIYLVNP